MWRVAHAFASMSAHSILKSMMKYEWKEPPTGRSESRRFTLTCRHVQINNLSDLKWRKDLQVSLVYWWKNEFFLNVSVTKMSSESERQKTDLWDRLEENLSLLNQVIWLNYPADLEEVKMNNWFLTRHYLVKFDRCPTEIHFSLLSIPENDVWSEELWDIE